MARSDSKARKQNATKDGDQSQYYTRLLVYRARQLSLGMMVLLFTVIFTSMIFTDLLNEKHWLAIAAPLVLLGLVFLLFPATEAWEYKAWQTKTEQIERHFLD